MDATQKLKTLRLTPLQQAALIKETLSGEMSQNQLAKEIGWPQSAVSKKLSLLNLTPTLKAALDGRKIAETIAYELSLLPPEKQKEFEAQDLERLHIYDLRENRGKVLTHPICGAQFRMLTGPAKFCPVCGKEL